MCSGFSTIEVVSRRSVACLIVGAGVLVALAPSVRGALPRGAAPIRGVVQGVVRGPVRALGAARLAQKGPPPRKAPVKGPAKGPIQKGRLLAQAAPPPVTFAPRAVKDPGDPREQRIGRLR